MRLIPFVLLASLTLAIPAPIGVTAASPHPTVSTLYSSTCAYCHGASGQGGIRMNAPALWGPESLLSRSAYQNSPALTAFIRQYMPPTPVNGVNPGMLTETQAHSLALYLLQKNAK